MNPRTDLDKHDDIVVRAFATIFRKCGQQFQFAIDSGVQDDEEVRAYLMRGDDESAVGVTAINQEEKFDRVVKTAESLGLDTEVERTEEHHESIGSYDAFTMSAKPGSVESQSWNVPHLIVYGSLTPEIEKVCDGLFLHREDIDYCDIRNHFVVFGESLDEKDRTELCDSIQNSPSFFRDQKRNAVSNVRTANLI